MNFIETYFKIKVIELGIGLGIVVGGVILWVTLLAISKWCENHPKKDKKDGKTKTK